MPNLQMPSTIILLQNLPINIDLQEIKFFFDGLVLEEKKIKIITKQNETSKAYIDVQNEKNFLAAIEKCKTKLLRSSYRILATKVTKSVMRKELLKAQMSRIRESLVLTCEWIGCGQKFNDRSLYLSHINRIHVSTFDPLKNDQNKCLWQGCLEENLFFCNREHFQLHLSLHAHHNQLMNIGQQIVDETDPKLKCYFDDSTRNSVTDPSSVLICGWDRCKAEFYDVETFFCHTEAHAIEDVAIPMMSKEKLEKIRFAKCQWVNCQAAFKKKSHLKMHLSSHTQKKFVGCPVCGDLFINRASFLNHCYRQETPTNLESVPITNFVVDGDGDDQEGILTIDESANQSSFVIRLPHNIPGIRLPSQATIIDSSQIQDSASKTEQGQNVALLVNFNSDQNQSVSSNNNNLIQLRLTSDNDPVSDIVREFQCSLCPKSFNTEKLLGEHMTKHLKKFPCPHCTYSAGIQSRLREHILFCHNSNYDFKCTFCEQRFKIQRFLKRHIEETHQSQKRMKCNVCQLSFNNSYSLKKHYRIQHLKEQMIFSCHLCCKKYNRGNNLSRHLKSTHRLKIADGWSRFTYDKQPDGIYRINQQCFTKTS